MRCLPVLILAALLAASPVGAQWSDPPPHQLPSAGPSYILPENPPTPAGPGGGHGVGTVLGPAGAATRFENTLTGRNDTLAPDGAVIREDMTGSTGTIQGPDGFATFYDNPHSPNVTVYGEDGQVAQGFGPLTRSEPLSLR